LAAAATKKRWTSIRGAAIMAVGNTAPRIPGPRNLRPRTPEHVMPPTPIQRIDLPHGTRWILPMRPLGAARLIAIVPGVMAILPLLGLLSLAVNGLWTANNSAEMWMAILLPLIILIGASPFLMLWLILPLSALTLLVGHMRVEVIGPRMTAIYCLGPLRMRRQWRTGRLRELRVRTMGEHALLATLWAQVEHQKPLALARWYPGDWLQDLAMQVRSSLEQDARVPVVAPGLAGPDVPAGYDEPVAQPASSKATIQQHAQGWTVTLPPNGFRATAWAWRALAAFATLMAPAITLIPVAELKKPDPDLGGAILAAVFVWSLAIGLWVHLIDQARSIAIIDVVTASKDLMLTERRLWGVRQRHWAWSRIESIFQVSHPAADIASLIFTFGNDDPPVAVLSNRRADELAWLAWQLRHVMNKPARPPKQPDRAAAAGSRHAWGKDRA
jgi:hypothetical protein